MKYEDFINEVHEKVKDEEELDRPTFERKIEEVASAIGRGARISIDKLDEWSERAKDSWPEVEKKLEELGSAFVSSLKAFGDAFRRGYEGDK